MATHYSELKIYALSTEGVLNASCEFDVESLRPTYRLLIGIPGKSNAFAISSKLGLPEHIIEEAGKLIGKQERTFEDLISDLEESRITIEKEQDEIRQYKAEIEKLKQSLAKKSENLEASRARIINEAKEQASMIISEAKEYADESIRKFNRWIQQGGNVKDMEEERAKLREKLGDSSDLPIVNALNPGKG